MNSKIRTWLPWSALLLIVAGQLNYLPHRLAFLRQTWAFAQAPDQATAARLAYAPADYDLLEWVKRETVPKTTILLVTAAPKAYGTPAYVLYHRAIYHLYPRSIRWAAPVPPTHYPAWWIFTDLTEADIRAIAKRTGATAVLASGFSQVPLDVPALSFNEETYLMFLEPGR